MANIDYSETSSSEDLNWISDWCDEPCNRFFCEVPTSYITDDFNLFGLSQYFDNMYEPALSRILDEDDFSDDSKLSEDSIELNAQKLYGMIHARFLTTSQGLKALRYKVKRKHYGTCPRVLCPEQPLIPCGLSERFGKETVRLYCPRCEHIYSVNHPNKGYMDGACFGPALPHLFLMVYREFLPVKKRDMVLTFKANMEEASKAAGEETIPTSVTISDDDEEADDPTIIQFGNILGPATNAGAPTSALVLDRDDMADEKRKDIDRQKLINRHARKVQNIYQPTINAVQKLRYEMFHSLDPLDPLTIARTRAAAAGAPSGD